MHPAYFSVAAGRDGETLCLTLAGELDWAVITRVEEALAEAWSAAVDRVVIDLSGLTFLDLAGLKTILRVHARAQAERFDLTVVRPRGLANRIFTLTRAGETLPMADHP